jgi:Tfp pilus assembly protein PilX
MYTTNDRSRGFTLIASLLLLLLLSGIAIGLLMSVSTEGKVGGHDVQNSLAYRSAEGAIEQMTSNLSNTFQSIQAPTAGEICALDSQYPVDPTNSVTYTTYTLTPTSGCSAPLTAQYTQILAGSYQGLFAQVIPVTLNVTAQRNSISQEQVSMMRNVEVALIPVFQFGIFSNGDLSFFSGPDFSFGGRVHTNGDLYLSVGTGSTLTFFDNITAYGNVIRTIESNGVSTTVGSMNQQGTVDILTASGGCNQPNPPACRAMKQTEGSANAPPPYTTNQNANWPTISESYYNGWITDGNNGNPGGTGATSLSLPFASGTTMSGNPGPGPWPFEIIRRPPPGESTSSTLGASRLANEAQIRVLISDIESDLHFSDWNGNPLQDIPLGSLAFGGPTDLVGLTVGGTAGYYFAWANTNALTKDPGGTKASTDPDFIPPAGNATGYWPLLANPQTTNGRTGNSWLLVEAKWSSDEKWHGITTEWLGLGFARGLSVPNAAKGIANNIHPSAILIFQQPADRNGDGIIGTGVAGACTGTPCAVTTYAPKAGVYSSGSTAGEVERNNPIGSPFNWLPINFYDSREGEDWDNAAVTEGTGTPNGVMNATEIDVRNLQQWLAGKIGTTGTNVDSVAQNGYILYFSDRRGEQYHNGATSLVGEYGFEDVVNIATSGVPDGVLEPFPPGKNMSPEDLNENGTLENYGAVNVGNGFGINTNTAPPNPYAARIALLYRTGRKNQVTGARHVVKLVDGSMGYLPTAPGGTGGFTLASENPVYVQGDYNTSSLDPTWANPSAADPPHAAAAVIADAVTVLSNTWQDAGFPNAATPINGSLADSANSSGQSGTTSYYRMAIAGGKGMSAWNPNAGADTGTDGGLHNFIRYLENWGGSTLNYKGSLVSLYYSTYATGTYKCCNLVYSPPVRNYIFDPDFALPAGLPPGTPMFRDVDNLSYRQTFTPRNGVCF